MSAPNQIVKTLSTQWAAVAPKRVIHLGRTYKPSRKVPSMYDNERNEVTFSMSARKRRDEIFGSMIKTIVRYDVGADLYDVRVVLVDGGTLDSSELASVSGVYAGQLATILETL